MARTGAIPKIKDKKAMLEKGIREWGRKRCSRLEYSGCGSAREAERSVVRSTATHGDGCSRRAAVTRMRQQMQPGEGKERQGLRPN